MANKKPKNSLWVAVGELMGMSIMKDRFYKDKIHKALKVEDKEEAKRLKKIGDEFDKWVKALRKLPDTTQMWELDKKDIELFGDDIYTLPSASWTNKTITLKAGDGGLINDVEVPDEIWIEPESNPVSFEQSLARATPEEIQRWLES